MAYAQDTITSANAANDYVTVLDGLLTTAGWETVETLTPSGNFRNRVYKSPGTSNLCGYDWYLGVCWTTIGTENYVRVFGFQSYNSGTHIASGISAPVQSLTTPSNAYVTGQPTTGFLGTTTINMGTLAVTPSATSISALSGSSNFTTIFGFQTLIPSSAFGYWMSVTLDHVALWTTVATNVNHAVISSLVMDDDYVSSGLFNTTPIVNWTSSGFGISSHILGVAPTTSVWTAAAVAFSGTYGAKLPALSDTYLDAFAWQPIVYLNYMAQGSSNPTPATSLSGFQIIGHVPDFLLVYGGSMGDTVEVDSATYVLTGPLIGTTGAGAPTVAVLVE